MREQLSERLTGAIDLIYTRGRGLSGPTAGLLPNSTLTTLSATLTYKITESFNVDTGIRRSEVEYGSSSAKATQNAIYAALRYDWPKLAVSR